MAWNDGGGAWHGARRVVGIMGRAGTRRGHAIAYLADYPGAIPTLAGWQQVEWGDLNPETTVDERIQRLRHHLRRHGIPVSFVALERERPVGCASLIETDMEDYAELSPWLASVFVVPELRRRGIGTALVERVEQQARELGVTRLYLFTPDREGFYADLDWEVLERTRYRDRPVTIMSKRL